MPLAATVANLVVGGSPICSHHFPETHALYFLNTECYQTELIVQLTNAAKK
jgi:hypothetical protein